MLCAYFIMKTTKMAFFISTHSSYRISEMQTICGAGGNPYGVSVNGMYGELYLDNWLQT